MASWESNISYVRAVRHVKPTFQLEAFLAKAYSAADVTFGKRGVARQQQLGTEHGEIVKEGIRVPAATIYTPDALYVTLFERRARAADGLGQFFNKIRERMDAPELPNAKKVRRRWGKTELVRTENPLHEALSAIDVKTGAVNRGKFALKCTAISEPIHGNRPGCTEFGLQINRRTPQATALEEQADLIARTVDKTKAGIQIRGAEESLVPVLCVPFMRVASSEATDFWYPEFTQQLNLGLSLSLELGDVHWES